MFLLLIPNGYSTCPTIFSKSPTQLKFQKINKVKNFKNYNIEIKNKRIGDYPKEEVD